MSCVLRRAYLYVRSAPPHVRREEAEAPALLSLRRLLPLRNHHDRRLRARTYGRERDRVSAAVARYL